MAALRRIADRLIALSAIIGSAGLLIEMGIIVVDVVGRAFFMPLFGSQDLITMVMVILVFGGMAVCDRTDGHIIVDLLETHYPPWFNRVADAVSAFVGAAIFLAIAWAVYESAKISLMLNLATNLLDLPKAWFQWILCGFAVLTACGMLLRGIELTFAGRDVRKSGALRS